MREYKEKEDDVGSIRRRRKIVRGV